MLSPAIRRCKSAPDITSPHLPSKSVVSSRSAGSPLTTWPKKFGDLLAGKTKDSDLTEEKLQEFNRRNAVVEARSSPYYKGLTDSSLIINREKLSGSSLGRESRATSYVNSSSKSSFVVKVQEWGSSCFTSKGNERSPYSSSASSLTKSSRSNQSSSSSSSRVAETVALKKIRSRTMKIDSESDKKKPTLPTMEKPLRERDSKSPLLLPLPPPAASPPESLPYPPPEITPPAAQSSISLAPTPPLLEPPPTPPPAQTLDGGGHTCDDKEIRTKENEIVYIWAGRYRPERLQDFLCNREKALLLKNVVRSWRDTSEECGHFIFEGNPGVGKRTMIWALLREAFGPDKIQARQEYKKFQLKGEEVESIHVNLKVSLQHVEVNLSELKGYEKHIIVELIKERNQMFSDPTLRCNQDNCKAIILYEAEKLSTDALPYIKWMLQKFKGCDKVFFCCRDAKKLQPILPLCKYVQLNQPSMEEILEVLKFIAEKEGIQLPLQLAYKIAVNSKNNLRQAIRSFEATWHFHGCNASLKEDQVIKTGWEDKIANIARNVLEEQSPKQLFYIRGELQNLIEHNVAPEFIFQTLREEVKRILPEHLQPKFDHLYVEYQKNHGKKYSPPAQQEELGKRQNDQRENVQQFMRIEEFIARFMSWYKGLVVKNKQV